MKGAPTDARFQNFLNSSITKWAEEQAELKTFVVADCLERCESPIEAYLCVALHFMDVDHYTDMTVFRPGAPPHWPWDGDTETSYDKYVDIYQQVEVDDYRLDFLIVAKPVFDKRLIYVAVECDGHDYHERTRDQAARDRKRDRYLTAKGFKVFRFTGREIVRNAHGCAQEISTYLYDIGFESLGRMPSELELGA